ncbi:60S ribosomal protein L7-2 [Bienertia sinuspersici]
MTETEEQPLNYIEETVLKKRKHSEDWAIKRRQQLLERQWKIKENKKYAFKRPEDYIKEYRRIGFGQDETESQEAENFNYAIIEAAFCYPDTGSKACSSTNSEDFELIWVEENFQWYFFKSNRRDSGNARKGGAICNLWALGKYGILCLEDMVHEIHTVGPHFKEATRFLWPFSLAKPEGEFLGKKNTFKNGGDSGNREERINDLIAKMI